MVDTTVKVDPAYTLAAHVVCTDLGDVPMTSQDARKEMFWIHLEPCWEVVLRQA
ncbi:MAG: hypothetical protein CM1200mP22_30430 [Dehalococcoidia bacterium]|nr:MAG: hypothetical protein CM1200mP22_30430 [Dehalococcoidia bacterium]